MAANLIIDDASLTRLCFQEPKEVLNDYGVDEHDGLDDDDLYNMLATVPMPCSSRRSLGVFAIVRGFRLGYLSHLLASISSTGDDSHTADFKELHLEVVEGMNNRRVIVVAKSFEIAVRAMRT